MTFGQEEPRALSDVEVARRATLRAVAEVLVLTTSHPHLDLDDAAATLRRRYLSAPYQQRAYTALLADALELRQRFDDAAMS